MQSIVHNQAVRRSRAFVGTWQSVYLESDERSGLSKISVRLGEWTEKANPTNNNSVPLQSDR